MRNDVDKKIEELLNGIDKKKLNNGKKNIERFLSTSEGKKFVQNLDKNKVIDQFMQTDSEKIRQKLQNTDFSKFSNLKSEDILKKLR